MQLHELEGHLTTKQDDATLNLLKCSENLEDMSKQAWDMRLTRTFSKLKTKKNITELTKIRSYSISPQKDFINQYRYQLQKANKKINIIQQRSIQPHPRYATEYEEPSQTIQTKQYHYRRLETNKQINQNARFSLPTNNLLSHKSRSKTAFIHMLKNKTANLSIRKVPSQRNIIHNLCGIKVRMMAKKVEESKILNFTYKELKEKLDRITTLQAIQKNTSKVQIKRNRLYLKDILSKRHRLRQIKENLKVFQ